LQVPGDVSLVGYDDNYLTELIEPPLTTIRQPTYELGRTAMEYLVKLMKRQPISDRVHNFAPQLVIRQSVKKIGQFPPSE
jgi:DNA-binding LacI/PurR family transcriptional regulator